MSIRIRKHFQIAKYFALSLAGAGLITSCGLPSTETARLAGQPDNYSMPAGANLSRAAPGVLANDAANEKQVTVTLVTEPNFGSVTLQPDGAFNYEPSWRFTGYDTFSYQLVDGDALSEPVIVRISPPNVVVVLIDDLGQGDIGAYAHNGASSTPNLDALARAGMIFTHAHSAAAVCSPSRYSILTGNYPYRGRIAQGVWNSYEPATMIIPGQMTLGNLFRDAGYITGFIGKMHNGSAFWNRAGTDYTRNHMEIDFTRKFDRGPTQFGFNYSFVLPGGISGPPYAYFENDELVRFDSGSGIYKTFTTNEEADKHFVYVGGGWNQPLNGGPIGEAGWAIDNYDSRQVGGIMTRQALAFLERSIADNRSAYPPRPFFLFFAPTQLHEPYAPPEFFDIAHANDVVPATTGTKVAGTGATRRIDMIREADLMVGAIMDFLRTTDQLANTLVIVTSDNGPVIWPVVEGTHPPGKDGDTPLRGLKGNIYEGGNRVPLLARWGDDNSGQSWIAPGTSSSQQLGLNDLAATFLALVGAQRLPNQMLDSRSFLPAFLDGPTSAKPRRDHLIVQGNLPSSKLPDRIGRAFYRYDATGNLWKLILTSDKTDPAAAIQWHALYNLSADPGESTDQIGNSEYQNLLKSMQTEYLQLIVQPQTVVSWK